MKDINNTRYHLLLSEADWEQSQTEDPVGRRWKYSSTRYGVQLQAEVFTFQQQGSAATPLDPENRRDSDRDAYGHWYWIDETGTQIQVRWAEATAVEILFPSTDMACEPTSTGDFHPAKEETLSQPESLSGLAVTGNGYLIVGTPATRSLLVFDLYALDSGFMRLPLPPNSAASAQTTDFTGYDLAALANGGLLVLDRENRAVWRLDSQLRPVPATVPTPGALTLFQPKSGTPSRVAETPVAGSIALTTTANPHAIAPLPDGAFWILDQPNALYSTLWYYPADGSSPSLLSLQSANLVDPDADDLRLGGIRGYDLTYLPDTDAQGRFLSTGELFVVDSMGNQAYCLKVLSLQPNLTLRMDRRYYPLRSLERVALISTWEEAEAYYLQRGERWLPIKALPQQRYETQATLVLQVLDGHEPDCLWHRLCLDACISPETEVRVDARAAEQPDDLVWETWRSQPTLYSRPTVEVPHGSLWNAQEQTKPHTGTWELLFQQVQGRYLQLRLTLIGNGRTTPLIRALRAHYPRFSYLREYLPDVYQQDPTSASFLDRFLANPEGLFTTLEGTIAQAQTLMDVRTVPSEAVDWLADWIGLLLEPGWSDYQRRLLIAQAPYFFQRRGTQVGLLQAILLTIYPELGPQIFSDEVAKLCPTVRIVERFLTRFQSSVAAGDPTDTDSTPTDDIYKDAQERAHRFTVLIPTTLDDTTQRLVERIVTLEKPAHTAFTIKQYWALFRVGEVRLGLDTVLGQGGQFEIFRLGESALAEGRLGHSFPYTSFPYTLGSDRISLEKP